MEVTYELVPSKEATPESCATIKITSGRHENTIFRINELTFPEDVKEGEPNCNVCFDIIESKTIYPGESGNHVTEFESQLEYIVIDLLSKAIDMLEKKEANENG